MRAVKLLVALALVTSGAAWTAPARGAGDVVSGRIYYENRECLTDRNPKKTGLYGATVILRRDPEPLQRIQLDREGRFSTTMGGSGKVSAAIEFANPDIRVSPPGEPTYMAELGKFAPSNSRVKVNAVLDPEGPSAVANVLHEATKAFEKAKAVMPATVSIPPLPVHLSWNAKMKGRTHTGLKDATYFLGDRLEIGDHHWQWLAFTIAHEIGHLAHYYAVGALASGDHEIDELAPSPEIAYNEGLAHAFAGYALGGPVLEAKCKPYYDMSRSPAWTRTPLKHDGRRYQWSEARAGAAIWQIAKYIGGGDVGGGLARLYDALRDFTQHATMPYDLKAMWDALIQKGIQANESDHNRFAQLFAFQNIKRGLQVRVDFDDPRTDGSLALYEVHLRLSGPGGYDGCRVVVGEQNMSHPVQGSDGPTNWIGSITHGSLSYTWRDDCLMYGGDGVLDENPTLLGSGMWFNFPYLSGGAHHGDYELKATYVCRDQDPGLDPDDYRCTNTRSVEITVYNGLYGPVFQSVSLPLGAPRNILTFDETGNCQITGNATAECGV